MLDNVFNFFEKLVLNFTWTRFSFLVFLIILSVTIFALFESYTNYFGLNRLEKETIALERLISISENVDSQKKQESILEAFDHLMERFNSRFEDQPLSIGTMPIWVSKAAYTLFPWLLISFLMIFAEKGGRMTAIAGMLVVAIPLTIIGINLPDYSDTWINKWLYPWGSATLVIIAILVWQKKKQKP